MEHQIEFVEHSQYGKQIGKILDIKNMQKRPQAPKPIFLGLASEESGNQVPNFEIFENYDKCSRGFYAEWVRRFSKRAHEAPV